MTTSEFLNALRKVRSALFTIRFSDFAKKQNDTTREEIKKLKLDVMMMVERLEMEQLQTIANDLVANEEKFNDAIEDLKKELSELSKATAIIETISHVIAVVNTMIRVLP